jgi:O-antigen/teichoic acid export membrane protein
MGILEKILTKNRLLDLMKHTSVYSIANLLQSAASFFLLPLYLKFFSPDQYGVYSLLLMISGIGSAIFYLGITSALPTSYFESDDLEHRQSVFTTALSITLLGATLFLLSAIFFGHALSKYLFSGESHYPQIILVSLTGACGIVVQLFITALRLLRQTAKVAITGLLSVIISLSMTYYLVAFRSFGIDGPILVTLLIQPILLMVYGYHCRSLLTWRLSRHHAKVLVKFGIPTILVSFGVITIEWSDRVILQKLLNTTEVGIYSLGFRLGAIITPLVITPLAQVWTPIAFEIRKSGKRDLFAEKIIAVYISAGLALVFLSLLFSYDFFLLLKSPNYLDSTKYIPLILAGNLLNGLNNFFSMGAIFERKLYRIVLNTYILAAMSAALNFLLISKFGPIGAAATYFIVNLASPILTYRHSNRFNKISLDVPMMALCVLATMLFTSVAILLKWPEGITRYCAKSGLSIAYLMVMAVVTVNTIRRIEKAH